uniref:G-protein coupled receptors family 1 profile domain-containing protein n=1 Tax=Rhinolophus ferrumequinum TaxID=59479 RepID=A0A671G909_RHIFE
LNSKIEASPLTWPRGGRAGRGLLGHALVTFTCVCGIAGNSLVVWLLSCRVERTPYSMYVLHLAVAALLFLLGLVSLVSLETSPLANMQPLAREPLHRVKYFAYTAGLSLLTAIRGPRCLSILFPIWYKRHRRRRLAAGVCAGLCALTLVMDTRGSVFCRWSWRSDEKHCFTEDAVLISFILGLFTPVMAGRVQPDPVREGEEVALCGRQRPTRLYVVILASVLVHLPCALPLGLCWCFLSWDLQPQVQLLYVCLARLSSSVSSSANPVIYFLVGTRRGQGLRRVLWDTPELEGKQTPSSYTNEVGG